MENENIKYRVGDKVKVVYGTNQLFADDYCFTIGELAVVVETDYDTDDGYELMLVPLHTDDRTSWLPQYNITTEFSSHDIEQFALWQMKH